MKKVVHVVEFGCRLVSEPLEPSLAEELKARLVAKGLQNCYVADYVED